MSDCRFGVSPVNYPDPDPDCIPHVLVMVLSKLIFSHTRYKTADLKVFIRRLIIMQDCI